MDKIQKELKDVQKNWKILKETRDDEKLYELERQQQENAAKKPGKYEMM